MFCHLVSFIIIGILSDIRKFEPLETIVWQTEFEGLNKHLQTALRSSYVVRQAQFLSEDKAAMLSRMYID